MCFYKSQQWTADVWSDDVTTAREPARCDECHQRIHPGEWVREIYLQESEQCGACGGPFDDDDRDELTDEPLAECPEGECDFGIVEHYARCERCEKLLKAIEAAEIAEGCTGDSTQPYLSRLYEAMTDEENTYGDTAREMFPEIVPHLSLFGEVWNPRAGWSDDDFEPVEVYGGES